MDYAPKNMDEIYKRLQALCDKAKADLQKEGFSESQIHVEVRTIFHWCISDTNFQPFLNLRYSGTDTSIMTSLPELKDGNIKGDYVAAFEDQHKREYGFTVTVRILFAFY